MKPKLDARPLHTPRFFLQRCPVYAKATRKMTIDPTHVCVHNHTHLPRDIVAEAERYCRSEGLRLTNQRRSVLELLAHSATPLGAYDLLEKTTPEPSAGKSKRIAPIAIYRALDFLLEAGLIHRLESRNAFIVCPHRHGDADTIVFMICEACGQVEEATSNEVDDSLKSLARARGFKMQDRIVELGGRCSQCTSASVPN